VIGTQNAPLAGTTLDYVMVEYGGLAFSSGANLYLQYAAATVAHSTFRDGGNHGILGVQQGLAHISASSFVDNPGYAVLFNDASVNPVLGSLTATGNGTNAVGLDTGFGTNLTGAHVWEATGLPYVVDGIPTVAAGATLTVQPGVETRFMPNAGLTARGTLTALGTPTQPITFTGATQTPGAWRGLMLQGTAGTPSLGSALSYVTVAYGGFALSSGANLYAEFATATVAHSVFRDGGNHGLVGAQQGLVHLSDSSFVNNPGYAVILNDATVDANLKNLTAADNGFNAVGLAARYTAQLKGTHLWEAAGLPYIVETVPVVAAGGTLIVEPSVTLRFEANSGLTVQGKLTAIGTPTQPITFTGMTETPGSWRGLNIAGTLQTPAAGSTLRYVTVAYGGSGSGGANVVVNHGQVAIAHSILRDGGNDGLLALLGGAGSTIETSQIISNTNYGVRNTDLRPTRILLAANNWWGAASGPMADNTCNPGGTGSRVSANVAFSPFLADPNADLGPVAAADARLLAMTPERWFVPADGLSRIWVRIVLRDGLGRPLPGRQVRLQSTLGTVVDGGLTDVQGQAFAHVTSMTAGDSELSATLDLQGTCEFARSPVALVTFTAPSAADDLLPDAAAPYMNNQIEITPLPVVRGVPAKLRARLTNPNPFTISVDATFSIFQLGIGLTFGPVGQVDDVLIPGNSQGVIEVPWTPVISGHYCVELRYAWQAVGGAAADVTAASVGAAQGSGGGRSLRNLTTSPGPLAGPNGKPSLDKAQQAVGAVGKMGADKGALFIPKWLAQILVRWQFKSARNISKNLGFDPPRQDYRTIALPVKPSIPTFQPDNELSAPRAAALNALIDALLDVQANGDAAVISLDRYGGAAAANDLGWASQQAAALLYYQKQMGAALITAADRLDAFRQVLQDEGVPDVVVTADDLRAYQDRLRTQGFSVDEINAAKMLGMTDEEIEAARQESLAGDPEAEAGSLTAYLIEVADKFRQLGGALQNPVNFGGGGSGSSGAPLASTAAVTDTHNLIRLFESTNITLPVGNPLTQTAVVELRVRPIDLPPDWMVSVTPVTATLAAGEQTIVTVSLRPGTAAVQGTQPRVAIEGYAAGQLLDGVVLDVMLPREILFDGRLRLYLPVTLK
jgi:hypothetical protein